MAALKHSRVAAPAGIALILAALAALRWPDAARLPFLNDDYVFLDKVARSSFGSLWGFSELAFHWWRPWSREFHYWALARLAGPDEVAFHLANAALFVAVLVAFFVLARAWVGSRAAAFATVAVATMASWDLPLLWSAGAQDLWMMAWSLASLLAWRSDRPALSAAAFALALASKETAALLPAILIAHELALGRATPLAAIARAWPHALLTAAWAAVHPVLGGRLWQGSFVPSPPSPAAIAPWEVPLRAMGALVNLDAWPAPATGWPAAFASALPTLALMIAALLIAGWRTRPPGADDTPGERGVVVLGVVWAAVGWAPLMLVGLGWHAYYALFGALGVWLALARRLARAPAAAVAVVAAMTVLGFARAETPSSNWGDAWYQRRAGFFVARMREQLRTMHPAFPPHARLYFAEVPNHVGFLAGDGPALRVWYDERTLRAGFFNDWRVRAAGEPAGEDFFFRADSLRGWIELRRGAEDVAAARGANPRWGEDQQGLAAALLAGGDAKGAVDEYRKVAEALAEDAEPAYNAGVAALFAGDTALAASWLAEAARRPIVRERVRAAAREAGLDLWPEPSGSPAGVGVPPRR